MSRTDEHFRLRIQSDAKAYVRDRARRNLRSMTAEINFIIRDRMVREAAGQVSEANDPAASGNTAALQGSGNVNQAV